MFRSPTTRLAMFPCAQGPIAPPVHMVSRSSTICLPTLPCAWGRITPSLRVVLVGIARTIMVCAGVVRTSTGGERCFMLDAGGVCTCAVALVVCTAPWSLVRPTPVLSRVRSLSSAMLRTGRTALQGFLRWASGQGVPCAHKILRAGQTALQGSLWWASTYGVPCAHNHNHSSCQANASGGPVVGHWVPDLKGV